MRYFVAFLFSCLFFNNLMGELEVSPIFGDHMVLQREMPVPVWGRANPGQEVQVTFGEHQVSSKANKSGRWRVDLPEMPASSKGREMKVTGGKVVVFKDVLVGEVWICSGQSNMQYGWGKSSPFSRYNWGGDDELRALAAQSSDLPIRAFHVAPDASFSPKDSCRGAWTLGPSGSAVAFGFSYHLAKKLQVPVGVIVSCWGSSFIEGWMPLELTDSLPHFKKEIEGLWQEDSVKKVNKAIKMGVRDGFVWLRKRPNLLYNAMLYPLIPYGCRGVVWYQGEANGNQPEQYGKSLPVWFEQIRKEWGRENLHLLAVMLPGFGVDDGHPNSKSWAWFREAQLKANNLKDADVINTIDLGDAKNIHPSDKSPIAQRLATLANEKVYGVHTLGHGPIYSRHLVKGQVLEVTFSKAMGLKTTDGSSPRGFWIAGEDKKWFPAQASIDGNRVLLKAKDVLSPIACRYAFSGKPEVNLMNGNEQPAYPFRTDDWPSPMP
jgi:sialate O-acetylesterase